MRRNPPPIPIRVETWDRTNKRFVPKPTRTKFLKGPIPWSWIVNAARLRGQALEVGLCLWRVAGATDSYSVRLSSSELQPFGIDHSAKSRALKALGKAGLISIQPNRGMLSTITILNTNT